MLLDLSPILLSTVSKSRLRPLFNGTALGRCTPEDEDEDQDNVEDDSGDKNLFFSPPAAQGGPAACLAGALVLDLGNSVEQSWPSRPR